MDKYKILEVVIYLILLAGCWFVLWLLYKLTGKLLGETKVYSIFKKIVGNPSFRNGAIISAILVAIYHVYF